MTTMTCAVIRSEASPLASNPTPLPRFCPGSRRSLPHFTCGRRNPLPSPGSSCIRFSNDRSRPPVRAVRCPEPPWLVLPPSPPENPFSGQVWPLDLQMKGVAGGTEIPLSLRMVQMKKRLAAAGPNWTDSPPLPEGDWPGAVEGPTWRAVSGLVSMIGDIHRSVVAGGDGGVVDESVLNRAFRDRRDSFVWLLQRVFFSSPNLVVSLLVLLADYVAFSAESTNSLATATAASARNEKSEITAWAIHEEDVKGRTVVESAPGTITVGDYLNWFDIGIDEGNLERIQHEDEETCVERRRQAYERTIAEGEANSLVLSNYAQFLYRVASDPDRAEQYFQRAVMAEPRDAEAMSRYASFLWEERGDISGAEEMFLEAIEAEPGNHHYTSGYAWFLWKTGALDTCYPLDPASSLPGDDAD